MTLDAFAIRLKNAKRVANGYKALCPAHEDRNASLSVSQGDEGKLLVNCFAGCSTDEILAAIGLEMKDLFPDSETFSFVRSVANAPPTSRLNGNGSTAATPKAANTPKAIEAIYEYRDESGVLLYENVRYRPKSFRQRRPDGKGGYIYDLERVERVPYRLPEMLAALSCGIDEVWLVEGEKDADSLRLLGLTATSFKNWTPSHNQYIKDAHAVLFRDHDKPGIKQANDAARIIAKVAKSVKVIDLFDDDPVAEKHGKDVSDWIEARQAEGLNDETIAENLSAIVQNVDHWRPFGLRLGYTFGELQKLELEPRDEIIRGLARQEIGLINAVTNIGKTTLIRNLALSLIAGRVFAPLTVNAQKRRVAIIDSEDTLIVLRSDLNKMFSAFSDVEKNLVNERLLLICDAAMADEELTINKQEHFAALVARLAAFRPDIIFVDTISKCFVIHNENDNSEVKERVMKPLKRLAKLTNAVVLATHHIGKSKLEEGATREGSHRGRGASSFADQGRVILNLERDSASGSVILSCPKLKGNSFADQILRLDPDTRWFERIGENRTQTNYEFVIEMFADGRIYTTAEAVSEFEGVISPRTVKGLLGDGVKHGDLQKIRQGQYQKFGANLLENGESAKVQTV